MTSPKTPTNRQPMILNDKEERILKAVHDLECVTVQEIAHLLFSTGSRSYVRAILAKLCGGRDYDDQQFLYRFPLPMATKGTKTRVYCLGAKAWDVLAIEDAYRPAQFRHLSYSPLLHDLILSRFLAVATTYFAAQSDYKLSEIRTCYQLTRNPPRIPVVSQGKETALSVIPDAWLHLTHVRDGIEYGLWIEVDRGTENIQKFKRLVRNRLALVKSPQYEKIFHTKAVLFCYVTVGTPEQTEGTPEQTDPRLDNMLRWTEDVLPHKDLVTKEEELTKDDKKHLEERDKWASLFRFSTVDYETMYDQPHRLFTEPVWYKPDEPDPVPLFDQ
jgi:hypothetical protein